METQVGKGSLNVPVAHTVYKATAHHPVPQKSLKCLKERCVYVCVCVHAYACVCVCNLPVFVILSCKMK